MITFRAESDWGFILLSVVMKRHILVVYKPSKGAGTSFHEAKTANKFQFCNIITASTFMGEVQKVGVPLYWFLGGGDCH